LVDEAEAKDMSYLYIGGESGEGDLEGARMIPAGLRPAKAKPVSLKVGGGKRSRVFAASPGKPSRIKYLSLMC
jgi:hypothetical protein